jgi:Icc-related predicted phosphoesterase
MRILHCTDLHANDCWYRWLAAESPHYDLVCLTGDLLDLNPYRSTDGQLDRVMAHLQKIETPLAICSGNHDSVAGADLRFHHAAWLRQLRREDLWIDGDRFEFGGFSFRCIPWQGILPSGSSSEIWLIHSPPDKAPTGIARGGAGFGDSTFGEECRANRGPRLALSGHVHEPQSWRAEVGRTWSINPLGPENNGAHQPNHVDIDLDAGTAELIRLVGPKGAVRLW